MLVYNTYEIAKKFENNKILVRDYKPDKKITIEKKFSNMKISKNEKKNKENDNNMKCIICLTENKCFLFIPCKHLACCEKCSKKVKNCPICRSKIDYSFKIYV